MDAGFIRLAARAYESLNTTDPIGWDDDQIAPQLDANLTLGPEYIGWGLSLLLLGWILARTLDYFVVFPKDRPLIKWIVGVVCALEVCNAALNFQALYSHGVSQDRSDSAISTTIVSDALASTFTQLIAFIVQSFYAERSYRMCGNNRLIPVIIGIFMLGGLAGAIGVTYVEIRSIDGSLIMSYDLLLIVTLIWLVSSVTADIMITATLCWGLKSVKKERGFNPSVDELVKNLIRLSFETAALTTLCAAAGTITYATTYAISNVSMAFTSILPSCYGITLLYTLHARSTLRARMTSTSVMSQSKVNSQIASMGSVRSAHLAVNIQRTSMQRFDDGLDLPDDGDDDSVTDAPRKTVGFQTSPVLAYTTRSLFLRLRASASNMKTFATLAIVSALASSAVAQYAALTSQLNVVAADAQSLNKSLAAKTFTYSSAYSVHTAALKTSNDIKNATADCGNTASVTSAQATTTLNTLNNTILPPTLSALKEIIAAKSQFDSFKLGSLAKNDINTLRNSSDALAACLIKLAPTTQIKSQGQAIQTRLDSGFQAAQNAYASES
ncbi:uncharacterized protein L969DRAFT_54295 [Mixia osmundae IAM 14324]|uniref:DUF6534 domain-containing protein n=1 Tax=Mixia osmundae (strain CBS 9802 / IAM 14324 / JCM 22182 / KY 12970) TaxID=764103 RepID=G7E2A6_MIXOS|nr:uncharacterized protein L969DRAFT_54295 [Mixia osmundae IAM 14324]KEI36839.1 hypothetical protein L969DRAFT_54295 [Mixia osmundae IAM 14324]GAA96966.1 hypothetical protein E5Q_03640 [Mixia osmundae IAM 14324]